MSYHGGEGKEWMGRGKYELMHLAQCFGPWIIPQMLGGSMDLGAIVNKLYICAFSDFLHVYSIFKLLKM